MKIVFAASEANPYMKTGGLGDVAQALPLSLAQIEGNEMTVFLPLYAPIKEKYTDLEKVCEFQTQLSWRSQYTALYRKISDGVTYYFVDNEYYFARTPIYGHGDDGERFAFFSKAVLEGLVQLGLCPDVLHCNDWQTALIPVFYRAFYKELLPEVKTVFTIHNVEYQGLAHPYFLGDVLGLSQEYEPILTFDHNINVMKGAIVMADAVNTVSRTYASQLRDPYFAHGLAGIISDFSHKLSGIVNGIDEVINDPATDPNLISRYTVRSHLRGKRENKRALQEALSLPVRDEVPMLGMVSRLVSHKGTDLLCPLMEELASLDVQIVILGTGDGAIEACLADCARRHPDKISVQLRFDPRIASRIYAASDFYLMPSKSEPCGLSQLIAMRYGAIPIVHATGGLRDTVTAFDPTTLEGVGITFQSFDVRDFRDAIGRALDLYSASPNAFAALRKNAMKRDSSWAGAAMEYQELYRSLCKK